MCSPDKTHFPKIRGAKRRKAAIVCSFPCPPARNGAFLPGNGRTRSPIHDSRFNNARIPNHSQVVNEQTLLPVRLQFCTPFSECKLFSTISPKSKGKAPEIELSNRRKGDNRGLKLACQPRPETTIMLRWSTKRLSWTYVSNLLRENQK